jgi:Carboxypeptidase regulatory-like domain
MRFTTSIRLLALLAVMALIVPTVVVGQGITSGAVTGVVTDASNAVVPNATVTLKSEESGAVLTQTTGATGTFNFTLLKPGSYRVSLSQQGFRAVAEKVDVALGQTSTANIKLEVGSTSETLEVTSEAPLLQTEDANISTTFNAAQIQELPAPGGDITSYAQTAPGVLMNTGGSYGNFSAFGLPATSNLFTLNGNDENDPFLNLNNSGSSNLLLGQNEVQEVAVVSNGYTAQYGRQAGVQVDYTTKSGSNALHGDAAFWFNSSMFNANDWFQKNNELQGLSQGLDTPNKQPFAVNHMWAGSVGGPIVKDKLFFYVDQEGLYYALPSEQHVYLPTSAFQQAVLGNIAANNPSQTPFYTNLMNLYANSPAQAAVQPIQGDPTGGCGSGFTAITGFGGNGGNAPCTAVALFDGVNHNKEWLLTERIDYNISNSNKLFGRFKVDHGSQPTSTDLIDRPIFSTQSIQPEYEGQINFTHVFTPNIVNNAILSGLWYTAYFAPDSGQAAVLATTGGYSTISVGSGSITNIGGGTGAGQTPDFIFPQGRNSSMGQLTDDFSITKGNHTFKMGVNFRRDILVDYDGQSNTGGLLSFGSMNAFANGVVGGGTILPDGTCPTCNGGALSENYTTNGDVRIGFYSLGLYFQDEFRVSPNFKLTMAIRGDRNSNPICSQDCYSRFNTSFTTMGHDINTPYNAVIASGQHSAFPNVEKLALQPRIGFTWSPFGHTSTVLRGGIGVFSDLYQGVLMDELIGNAPGTVGFNVSPAPTTAGTNPAPVAPGTTLNGVPSTKDLGAGSYTSFLSAFSSGQNLNGILATNPFFTVPNYTSIASQINNPKYLEWNFEIQQAFGSKMTLNLDYVGTHGYDALIQNANLNASALPGTSFEGLPQETASGLSGNDPRFGFVRELQSDGINNYAGLVTTLTRRFTHGFQGSINYTFAHALDDLTTTNPGTPFNALYSMVYQINPSCLRCNNYGPGDADARHNITANYVWDLPFKTQSKLLNEAVSGWTIAGTFYAHSGLPWTPLVSSPQPAYQANTAVIGIPFSIADYSGGPTTCQVGGPGGLTTNTCVNPNNFPYIVAANAGNTSYLQPDWGNVGRNSFRGLGYFDTDMNVNKSFAVTERVKFELGGSFFNILNHPNFALPNPYVQDITGPFAAMTSLAVQPTTPYGAFQGAGVEGRLIQVHGKITF